MSHNFKDNQIDKKALQTKNKANPVEKGFETEKSFEKFKKEKKKRAIRDSTNNLTTQLDLMPL